MAAVGTAQAPVDVHTVGDDDDAWLYGDEGKDKDSAGDKQSEKKGDEKRKGVTVKKEDREEGEMSGEEGESQEKDDDDDSDDDNVQVTIGDIKAWSATDQQPRNLFKSGTNYQKPATGTPAKPATTTKGLDVEAQGTINGVPVYEFDLGSIENGDKPWRKPGADITDYFNYGFTEDTWQVYCDKQRRLSLMNESTPKTTITVSNNVPILNKSNLGGFGPIRAPLRVRPQAPLQPVPSMGTIDVIGGTAKDSRRPDEGDPIPVAGGPPLMGRNFMPVTGLPPPSLPPPHLPPVDYSIPPPGMPHSVPPPGMNVPPPGFTPVPDTFERLGVPPPGFPPVANPYDPFFGVPPDRAMPPPMFEEQGPPFNYGGPSHSTFNPTYSEAPRPSGPQHWEPGNMMSEPEGRERDWERERREGARRERERSPPPSHRLEEDFSGREAKYRPSDRERERERDRERERERERDRKRDRDGRRRSRSNDRDREMEMGRREREEDKHRSRRVDPRRHKGDDSDTESRSSSSKHKKSRRRRDKDDNDMAESLAGDETPKVD